MSPGDIVYVTKYCVPSGEIREMVVREHSDRYVQVKVDEHACHDMWLVYGRDCFASREVALKNAEERRARKIKSLEKQLAALKKLAFEFKGDRDE